MDELIAFVRARLDEDERTAQGAARTDDGHGGSWLPVYFGSGGFDARVDDHIARHDPARVLREIAAKRAILDWLGHQDRVYGDYSVIETLELVVRHLGAEFSDHPDYRAGWCPECEDGLVRVHGCNCGSPADVSVGYAHEALCGWEPCPNGCWERLHPSDPAQPSVS